MFKLICGFLICSSIVFSVAHAQPGKVLQSMECIDRLTNGHNDNTTSARYNLQNLNLRDYGRDYLAQAIAVIRVHVKELGCSKKSINFGKGPWGRSQSRCTLVARGVESSRVCYVESNLGYFLVSTGFLDDMTVVYNRWD